VAFAPKTHSTPAELVSILGQYLECGAAISGHDLSDPNTNFNLQLATRAWETLLAVRAPSP
jgi:hypothetical protein